MLCHAPGACGRCRGSTQGDRADRGMLALMSTQPKHFPSSLDPSPASSSDASAEGRDSTSRQLGELSASRSLRHIQAQLMQTGRP